MTRVQCTVELAVPVEQVRANLLDFSDRRPALWPGIEPSLYEVYELGDTSALVREGSRLGPFRMWAKERYDWSDPDEIRWTVEGSNFCAPGSRLITKLEATPSGGTRVHVDWQRYPTTLAARLMFLLIKAFHGRPISDSIRRAAETWTAPPIGGSHVASSGA